MKVLGEIRDGEGFSKEISLDAKSRRPACDCVGTESRPVEQFWGHAMSVLPTTRVAQSERSVASKKEAALHGPILKGSEAITEVHRPLLRVPLSCLSHVARFRLQTIRPTALVRASDQRVPDFQLSDQAGVSSQPPKPHGAQRPHARLLPLLRLVTLLQKATARGAATESAQPPRRRGLALVAISYDSPAESQDL